MIGFVYAVSDGDMSTQDEDRKVTVCASCLRACCWHGEFMCDDARTADVTKMNISDLRKLDRESADYWVDGH